jgi:ABC-type multidrug transport system ATPase subunit
LTVFQQTLFISNFLATLRNERHTTILISSQNLECFYKIFSRLILILRGRIVEDLRPVDATARSVVEHHFSFLRE